MCRTKDVDLKGIMKVRIERLDEVLKQLLVQRDKSDQSDPLRFTPGSITLSDYAA
jgi:hypothetical protein